jgi:hypothetical protein
LVEPCAAKEATSTIPIVMASSKDPVTAFCTVDKGNEPVASHGLLGQWRAYGQQGGYVIIFDTEQLTN